MILDVKNISLKFNDTFVIKNFSLQVNSLDKVLIYGKSGSGKTSFFNILLGLESNYEGVINVDRSKIAWVPQEFYLPVSSLRKAIDELFSLKINKINYPTDIEVYAIMKSLGLSFDSLNIELQSLSGGERQRFFIGLALLLKKDILLLDEPTSALDPDNIHILANVLIKSNTTLVAISHDMVFADYFDQTIHFEKQELKCAL